MVWLRIGPFLFLSVYLKGWAQVRQPPRQEASRVVRPRVGLGEHSVGVQLGAVRKRSSVAHLTVREKLSKIGVNRYGVLFELWHHSASVLFIFFFFCAAHTAKCQWKRGDKGPSSMCKSVKRRI